MKQYLALHPISDKPEKDGSYARMDDKGRIQSVNMYDPVKFGNGNRGWLLYNTPDITHWLSKEPVTGVLVSEEELKNIIHGLTAFRSLAPDVSVPDLDNLINSLTNKANQ